MKKTLTMIMALVLIALCSTTAIAQKHRHTDRSNDVTTQAVTTTHKQSDHNEETLTNESHDTVTLINTNGMKVQITKDELKEINQGLEEFAQVMEEFGQSMEDLDPIDGSEDNVEGGQLLGALNNTVGKLGQGNFFDYALLIPIIAIFGFFFAPVLIVGFILLYKYKRKKQHDEVVKAAIDKGAEIPEEYLSSYRTRSNADANAPVNNEVMNKGIRRIVIGIGVWILGATINVGILMGVGLFIIVLGGGEVLIHYLNNRGSGVRSEGTYRQQQQSSESLQKQEGKYEKSE